MRDVPTFGLIVPCHNGAQYLPRLLASVRAQTRPFDEIWLFDDGSTDNSAALAHQAGMRVLRADSPRGPAAARNQLAAACNCTWLHFHDVDDTMAPRYLERVAAVARADTDLIICDMLWVEEDTERVENHWRYDHAALIRHPAAYLLVNTIGGINGLYRRATFLAAGGFDETLTYWEDMDLNVRLFARGLRCTVVNEDLVTAYRRRASYSNANLGEVWRVKLRIMQRMLAGADAELATAIAAEAEIIGGRLATLARWEDVPAALALCRQAGGHPPTTKSPVLCLLKLVLPDIWCFRLQYRLRHPAKV